MKSKKIFIMLSFLGLLVSGCSKKDEDSSAMQSAMRVNIQHEPLSLDPRYGFDSKSQMLIKALFEGLTRIGLNGEVYPAIAERIEVSEDKKIYLFKLRACCWSNGKPIRASDFAYTWKNILSSDSVCPLADLYYPIKNAKLAKEKKVSLEEVGIHVLDEMTLRVELEHPAPYFLHLLSNPLFYPVCQEIDQSDSGWARKVGKEFVCNGPFVIKEWKKSQGIILEKNKDYHDAKTVQLPQICVGFVDDPYTSLLMFEKGEIDWMGDPFVKLPIDAVPALRNAGLLELKPYAGLSWLECNTECFPLNSSKIRKALAYSIDRQALVDHILIGQKIAFGVVPEMMSLLSPEERFIGNDFEKARQLFNEGLVELGITREQFPELRLTFNTAPGYKAIAEALQQQWKQRLDIDVTLECFEWSVCISHLNNRKYQLTTLGWISFYDDPIYNLQVFRYRTNMNNWAAWENTSFQKCLEQADHESEPSIRNEQLKQAEKILLEEMPVIPLAYQTFKFIKNDRIDRLLITDLGEVDFKWVVLRDH